MNICLIYSVARRRAAEALAIAAAAAVTFTGSGVASAQTGLMNYLDSNTPVIQASAVRTAADVSPGRLSTSQMSFGQLGTAGNSVGNLSAGSTGTMAPGAIAQAVGTVVGDPSMANANSIAQVGFGSCNSCQSSSCNGGCNSYSSIYESSMSCGIPCDPYRYINVEALYMERQGDGNFSYTRNVELDEFDFEWAPRITIGTLPNCVNGYEVSFTGPFEWDRRAEVRNAGGGINSVLSAGTGLDPALIEPFQNSTVQVQNYTSEYFSVEASKTLVGWDVAKLLIGPRYISLEEEYTLDGVEVLGGRYGSQTENHLIGGQIGLDLLYPVARHLYNDVRARAGVYANFAESDVFLFNNGVLAQRNGNDEVQLAGAFELGTGMRFQMGEALSVRAGGELWYLTGVATAVDQLSPVVRPNTGSQINVDEDLFFFGVTFGAELRF